MRAARFSIALSPKGPFSVGVGTAEASPASRADVTHENFIMTNVKLQSVVEISNSREIVVTARRPGSLKLAKNYRHLAGGMPLFEAKPPSSSFSVMFHSSSTNGNNNSETRHSELTVKQAYDIQQTPKNPRMISVLAMPTVVCMYPR